MPFPNIKNLKNAVFSGMHCGCMQYSPGPREKPQKDPLTSLMMCSSNFLWLRLTFLLSFSSHHR